MHACFLFQRALPYLAGALAVVVVSALPAAGADEDVLTQGRARSEAFLRGEVESIWRDMTAEMRASLGSVESLTALRDEVARSFGMEERIVEEEGRREGGFAVYVRTAQWSKARAPVVMQWAFDEQRKIAGFFVRQVPVLAESRFLDYRTKASLRLPFEGEWFVYWGGRTLDENYHAADRAQRFAVDLLVRRNGVTHAGDPADLRSYFCWDLPILAPADGTVVAAVGNEPDQAVGQSDPRNPAGNHVVIDLGNGEYVFLAHLRRGSITVAPGDRVSSGQPIGRCGNSGNTSEPHLHLHLQTTPDLATGEGLPAVFRDYRVGDRVVAGGELRQGQSVSVPE